MADKIYGFDACAKKMRTLSNDKEVLDVMSTTVRTALAETKKVAQQLIPKGIDPHRTYKGRLVAPGFASRNIKAVVFVDKKTRQKVTGLLGVSSEAFYAVQFVELGTAYMPAQPWLRPALAASSDKDVQMIADGMRQWIRHVAAKHASGVDPKYTGGLERAGQLMDSIGEVLE